MGLKALPERGSASCPPTIPGKVPGVPRSRSSARRYVAGNPGQDCNPQCIARTPAGTCADGRQVEGASALRTRRSERTRRENLVTTDGTRCSAARQGGRGGHNGTGEAAGGPRSRTA